MTHFIYSLPFNHHFSRPRHCACYAGAAMEREMPYWSIGSTIQVSEDRVQGCLRDYKVQNKFIISAR